MCMLLHMEEWGQSSADVCVEGINGVTNGAEELQNGSGRWGAGVIGEGGGNQVKETVISDI